MKEFINCLVIDRNDEIKQNVDAIYRTGEFSNSKNSPIDQIIQWLFEKIFELIEKIFGEKLDNLLKSNFINIPFIPTNLFVIFFFIAILTLIVIIAILIYRKIIINRALQKEIQEENINLIKSLGSSDKALNKSIDYYKNGDVKNALRYLYFSILLYYSENNIIRLDKAKTNKQYLNEFQNISSEIIEKLRNFILLFEKCWYGKYSCEKESFEYWLNIFNNELKGIK